MARRGRPLDGPPPSQPDHSGPPPSKIIKARIEEIIPTGPSILVSGPFGRLRAWVRQIPARRQGDDTEAGWVQSRVLQPRRPPVIGAVRCRDDCGEQVNDDRAGFCTAGRQHPHIRVGSLSRPRIRQIRGASAEGAPDGGGTTSAEVLEATGEQSWWIRWMPLEGAEVAFLAVAAPGDVEHSGRSRAPASAALKWAKR